MTTYVLVANSSKASLYSVDNLRVDALEKMDEFDHPKSRQKWSDIVTDKRGRYQTEHGSRCSYEKTEPKDLEAENFARELVDKLKSLDKKTADQEKIILVAPPGFQGILRKLVEGEFGEIIDITKDYTQLSPDDLLERLREHIYI